MEYLIVIALIVGVIGWAWLRGRMQQGLNRAIQRKSHEQGQRLIKETVSVTAPAMPASSVMDAVISELEVFDTVSAVKQRAYSTRVDSTSARVDFGNKMLTCWAVAIIATEMEEGVNVLLTPLEGTEVDGVIPGSRELGLVHDRVRAAVKKLNQQPKAAGGAA